MRTFIDNLVDDVWDLKLAKKYALILMNGLEKNEFIPNIFHYYSIANYWYFDWNTNKSFKYFEKTFKQMKIDGYNHHDNSYTYAWMAYGYYKFLSSHGYKIVKKNITY